ncbi:MAG: hypothetical protein HQM08_30960 [Candidatus Riflebacteria bacterium]|nr:hypothetical protein [Candidatus Riflebacteria bacterium]
MREKAPIRKREFLSALLLTDLAASFVLLFGSGVQEALGVNETFWQYFISLSPLNLFVLLLVPCSIPLFFIRKKGLAEPWLKSYVIIFLILSVLMVCYFSFKIELISRSVGLLAGH